MGQKEGGGPIRVLRPLVRPSAQGSYYKSSAQTEPGELLMQSCRLPPSSGTATLTVSQYSLSRNQTTEVRKQYEGRPFGKREEAFVIPILHVRPQISGEKCFEKNEQLPLLAAPPDCASVSNLWANVKACYSKLWGPKRGGRFLGVSLQASDGDVLSPPLKLTQLWCRSLSHHYFVTVDIEISQVTQSLSPFAKMLLLTRRTNP